MIASGYIIRPTGVAHETIDGETVIIDMQQGAYYRLEGAASSAWEQLAQGSAPQALCAMLAGRFIVEPTALQEQVTEFLAALQGFDLIVAHEVTDAVPASDGVDLTAFPGLLVHRFTDLQELFWLDPVHEVDDTGWPTSREGLHRDQH
jgi:hypothetical protein